MGAIPAAGQVRPDTIRVPQPDTARADTTRRAIVHADSLAASVEDEMRVQRLLGHVRVRQDSTRLRSNRALRYLGQGTYLFVGEVVIIERGDTLRADTVRYDKNRKVGQARGHVRLTDGAVHVRAPSALYFAEEKRSQFQEGVTLVDSASVLTSRAGEYFSDEKRAEFYDDVRFENERTYLEADSVTYFRKTGGSKARGHVFVERKAGDDPAAETDTTTRTLLFGQRARNRREDNYSRVEGRALLVQIRKDSTGAPQDTLLVRAHRMEATRVDTLRRMVAVDSVRIWQRDLAATADSAVFERRTRSDTLRQDETRLFRTPAAWFERSQVTGDTIRVVARNRSVDTVFVHHEAFAAQLDTTLNRIQQLRGQRLTGYFKQDSLRRLAVEPNAEAIWYLKKENGQPNGATKASGDRIVIYFKAGEVQRVSVQGGVQSTYYSESSLPEDFQLDGFQWRPDQRPTKEQLFRGEQVQHLQRRVLAQRPLLSVPPNLQGESQAGSRE